MKILKRGKVRLDIACGNNKKKGFSGVDIWPGADLVCDLEKFPWPFEDNSVDEIYCSHYIEHTPDLISFMNEVHRILKPAARAEFIAPYYSSIRAWQDPTHLRAISEATFYYYSLEWRKANRLEHYPITADFDFSCNFFLTPEWQQKSEDELRFAMRHYINVVSDIHAVLVKRRVIDSRAVLLSDQAAQNWEQGNTSKAVRLARKSVAIEANLGACLIVAEYELGMGNHAAATKEFKRAIDCDGSSLEAHAGLVRTYVQRGCHGLASRLVARVQKNKPDLAAVLEAYLPRVME